MLHVSDQLRVDNINVQMKDFSLNYCDQFVEENSDISTNNYFDTP